MAFVSATVVQAGDLLQLLVPKHMSQDRYDYAQRTHCFSTDWGRSNLRFTAQDFSFDRVYYYAVGFTVGGDTRAKGDKYKRTLWVIVVHGYDLKI